MWWTRWIPASASLLGALGGDVADRGAALEVGLLGDQPGALEDLLEVALRQALALGDHAEAVRAGGLGRLGVLEDLLGLHHRVHRRVGLGVARLGAEAAVLGAAAGLRVDQRAEVRRVAEALGANCPGAFDELADRLMTVDLGELEGFVERDQRRHPAAKLRSRPDASSRQNREVDEIRTRLATVDDVDAMIAVFTAGLETYREFAPEGWQPPEADRNQTREVLADPRTWAMLALVDGEPVGHVSFAPAHERSSGDSPVPWPEQPVIPGLVHLWQLFVLSPWWGSGIAARLHDAGIFEMRARGYERARLFAPSGQAGRGASTSVAAGSPSTSRTIPTSAFRWSSTASSFGQPGEVRPSAGSEVVPSSESLSGSRRSAYSSWAVAVSRSRSAARDRSSASAA